MNKGTQVKKRERDSSNKENIIIPGKDKTEEEITSLSTIQSILCIFINMH